MKVYPSIGQSVSLTFLVIASMLVFLVLNIALNDIIGQEASMFIYYVVAIGVPAVALHYFRKKKNGSANYNLNPQDYLVIIAVMLIALGIQFGITSPIANSIPMSDWIKQAFAEIADMDGILGFLTIAVAAPILEEFIFRGIVLDGLLKNTSPWKAILISSLLFGFVHLNPWQFIGATIIGFFMGWVYYKTHNLLYCMLIHFANNGFAFLLMQFSSTEEMMDETLVESYGGMTNMLIIIPVSILVVVLGIKFLNKRFAENPIEIDEASSL
jgi:membrane protease YdiL (CAAX protease family)